MEQWEEWFREKQVERTILALKKNNFEALFLFLQPQGGTDDEILILPSVDDDDYFCLRRSKTV